MTISLKTRNLPKLLIVWAVNVAVFSGVVTGPSISGTSSPCVIWRRESRRTRLRDGHTPAW